LQERGRGGIRPSLRGLTIGPPVGMSHGGAYFSGVR
jgi:hypothetical protein